MSRRKRYLADDLARAEARMRQTQYGIEHDLLKLRIQVGPWAFKALRAGLPLHRWTGTSPTNWWVESRRGGQLWHNDNTRWGDHPSLFLFRPAVESDGLPHPLPFQALYVLKSEYRS